MLIFILLYLEIAQITSKILVICTYILQIPGLYLDCKYSGRGSRRAGSCENNLRSHLMIVAVLYVRDRGL